MNEFIVDDILISSERFLGKTKYFMLSEKREKYIKLTEEQYNVYSKVIPWLYEELPQEQVEWEITRLTNGSLTLEKLLNVFKAHNLSYELAEEVRGSVEVDFSSRKIVEVPLEKWQEKHHTLLKVAWYLMKMISVGAVLGAIYILIFQMDMVIAAFDHISHITFEEINSKKFLFIAIWGFLAVPGHEMGHILTADHYGMKLKSFNFSMRWGVNFLYYIKYYNFYGFRSLIKLRILFAGAYMNFIQGCICFLLFVLTKELQYVIVAVINLFSIINNILPKGSSDGYHMFCILTGMEGIRWKMIKIIATIMKEPRKILTTLKSAKNIALIIYFMSSYGLSLFACYSLLRSITKYFGMIGNETVALLLYAAIILFVLISVTQNLFKFGRNLKKI